MSKSANVTLAGKTYEIHRLPAMKAIVWRKSAQELMDKFPKLAEAYQQETDNVVASGVEVLRMANGLVESLVEIVMNADPNLDADKDFILGNAFDEEFIKAFETILVLNFPLSTLAQA